MKITNKTVCISFEHEVKVGNNGAIEATICHQAWLYKNKEDKIDVDLEFTDVVNVKFLGIPVEGGYQGYKKFKTQMQELGINVDKLMDEASAQLITDKDMMKLKAMYKDVIK